MQWDVIIIGAGPAGLTAAIRAAKRQQSVLLLEKNRKPGVKILMSGGTRCNLTHDTDARGIVEAFGPVGRFLHSALARLDPRQVVQWFADEGVSTVVEPGGKIFPASDKAADVLDALLSQVRQTNCVVAAGEPVAHVARSGDGFRVATTSRELVCRRLLIASGGKSYPGCGTAGDGYAWAQSLGHTIVTPRPALTPITSNQDWVRGLAGITLPDVELSVMELTAAGLNDPPAAASRDAATCLARCRGSLLFAHFGLSGPVALDVSRQVSGHRRRRDLRLWCDLFPDLSVLQLDESFRTACAGATRRAVLSVLAQRLPHRVAEVVHTRAGVAPERRAAELSKAERQRLVNAAKRLEFTVTGTLGFEKAEVTAGGVSLEEVDSRNMQSKIAPNLYFAGEVLDLDGPIGGYNFQAAFSTGWLAGECV